MSKNLRIILIRVFIKGFIQKLARLKPEILSFITKNHNLVLQFKGLKLICITKLGLSILHPLRPSSTGQGLILMDPILEVDKILTKLRGTDTIHCKMINNITPPDKNSYILIKKKQEQIIS